MVRCTLLARLAVVSLTWVVATPAAMQTSQPELDDQLRAKRARRPRTMEANSSTNDDRKEDSRASIYDAMVAWCKVHEGDAECADIEKPQSEKASILAAPLVSSRFEAAEYHTTPDVQEIAASYYSAADIAPVAFPDNQIFARRLQPGPAAVSKPERSAGDDMTLSQRMRPAPATMTALAGEFTGVAVNSEKKPRTKKGAIAKLRQTPATPDAATSSHAGVVQVTPLVDAVTSATPSAMPEASSTQSVASSTQPVAASSPQSVASSSSQPVASPQQPVASVPQQVPSIPAAAPTQAAKDAAAIPTSISEIIEKYAQDMDLDPCLTGASAASPCYPSAETSTYAAAIAAAVAGRAAKDVNMDDAERVAAVEAATYAAEAVANAVAAVPLPSVVGPSDAEPAIVPVTITEPTMPTIVPVVVTMPTIVPVVEAVPTSVQNEPQNSATVAPAFTVPCVDPCGCTSSSVMSPASPCLLATTAADAPAAITYVRLRGGARAD